MSVGSRSSSLRGRPRRSVLRGAAAVIATAVAVLAAGACAPANGGLKVPTYMGLWAAGDSLTVGWTPYSAKTVFSIGVSGAGYATHAVTPADIPYTVATFVSQFGAPDRIVIMGGTNDAGYSVAGDAVNAMIDLQAFLALRSIDTWWVAEPGTLPARAAGLAQINAWVLAQPQNIDCRNSVPAANFVDGIHPDAAGYQMLADCITNGLPT